MEAFLEVDHTREVPAFLPSNFMAFIIMHWVVGKRVPMDAGVLFLPSEQAARNMERVLNANI